MSNNNHKMKGLLKGLRYISQIFDEEKEQEMKIGLPTDVKHVAHIGWDGPSVDSSPSWMRDFKAPGEFQSAPLNGNGDPLDKPEIKWVSEDSNRRSTRSEGEPARDRDVPDVPRSRRHASSENIVIESLGKEGSTKSRQSRKSKESSKSSRQLLQQDSSAAAPESPSKKLPDIPKKTRRKKSKESDGGGSVRSSRSKEPENEGSIRSSRSKESETGGSKRSSRSKESENGGSTRSSRSKATNGSSTSSRTSTLADPPDSEFGSDNNKEIAPPFVEEQRDGK